MVTVHMTTVLRVYLIMHKCVLVHVLAKQSSRVKYIGESAVYMGFNIALQCKIHIP